MLVQLIIAIAVTILGMTLFFLARSLRKGTKG
jgi:hypothetical protein